MIDADDSDLRKLTDAHGTYWSIDDSRILFASDHDGQSDIYIVSGGSTG